MYSKLFQWCYLLCSISILYGCNYQKVSAKESISENNVKNGLNVDADNVSKNKKSLKQTEFKWHKAHNGLIVGYKVLLPKNYNPEIEYPALFAFPPKDGGIESANWAINELWGEEVHQTGWIVIVPVAPKEGWLNHPAHHAMNDLLKLIQSKYKIKGKFHMFGISEGAEPASIYSNASKQFFQSLTTIGNHSWVNWYERYLAQLKIPITLIIGAEDAKGQEMSNNTLKVFKKHNVDAVLKVFENQKRPVSSMHHSKVIQLIEERVF